MKAELSFNPQILTDDMKIHYFSSLVTVEREGNKVLFAPNREILTILDKKLEDAGIDNKEIRQAIVVFRLMLTSAELLSTLVNGLADKYLYRVITAHEKDVDFDKYQEKIVTALQKLGAPIE